MGSLNSIKLDSESARRESAGFVARIIEEGHKTSLTDRTQGRASCVAVLHLDLPLVHLCGHSGCTESHHLIIFYLIQSIRWRKKKPKGEWSPILWYHICASLHHYPQLAY